MKGILFKPEKIRWILEWDWEKWGDMQTRRLIKPQPEIVDKYYNQGWAFWDFSGNIPKYRDGLIVEHGKYKKNEIIYVKETWGTVSFPGGDAYFARLKTVYKLDGKDDWMLDGGKWKSPMFMPESASRIKLQITDVKVERVQDISEEDAFAEGVSNTMNGIPDPHDILEFHKLWDKINKSPYTAKDNPYIFAYKYRLHTQGNN